jgi:hypothetical protein
VKISAVINVDTRPQRDSIDAMFQGVCNLDFLVDGVKNKIKFLEGFDKEIILYVDEHLPIPYEKLLELQGITDTLIVRKHTSEPSFNDWNYIRGLQMASGDYVIHFDQDCAAFTSGKEAVQEMIDLLETYSYVSYPSHWTPNAVHDPTFNYRWCSTRFFICKRQTLNFPEIIKCLTDYDYFCNTYKPSRACPWVEHFLGLIANSNVYYPPINLDKLAIFSWGSYKAGTLSELNNMDYQQVKSWVASRGIRYPNDLDA